MNKTEFIIKIAFESNNRKFILKAADEIDKNEWIENLNILIKYQQEQQEDQRCFDMFLENTSDKKKWKWRNVKSDIMYKFMLENEKDEIAKGSEYYDHIQ